jgi:Ca2+-binding RTX toxin-like protein
MSNSLRAFVAIGVIAIVHLFAEGVSLATTLSSLFGPTVPVQVFIGAKSDGTAQAVVWKRRSDGACASTTFGNSAGLSDNFLVVTSSGNDDVRILSGSSISSFCGFNLKGLVYNGHFWDLAGGGGNDTLRAGNGDTWIFGEDGDDRIFFAGFGNLFGGNGNDTLVAGSSVFTAEGLFGDSGNDCLEDRNHASGAFDCGPGTDRFSTAFGVPMQSNCETPISTVCP